MGESEVNQLVARLEQLSAKIDHLTDLFNRVAYGEGFARCARQNNRIDHLEHGVDLCHTRITGVKKWLLAGLVSILSVLAGFAWELIKSSIKHQ